MLVMNILRTKLSAWSRAGYQPHHYGPLWVLWALGLAPTKRQADLVLILLIVASGTWSYFIITGYTIKFEDALHPQWIEVYER